MEVELQVLGRMGGCSLLLFLLTFALSAQAQEVIYDEVHVNYPVRGANGGETWGTAKGSAKLAPDGTVTLVYNVQGRPAPVILKTKFTPKSDQMLRDIKAKPNEVWAVNHVGVSPLMEGKFHILAFTVSETSQGPRIVDANVMYEGRMYYEDRTETKVLLEDRPRKALVKLSTGEVDRTQPPVTWETAKNNYKGDVFLWSIQPQALAPPTTFAVKKIGTTKNGNYLVAMVDQMEDVEAGLGRALEIFEVAPTFLDIPTNDKQIRNAVATLRVIAKQATAKIDIADSEGNIVESVENKLEPHVKGLARLRRGILLPPDSGTTMDAYLTVHGERLAGYLAGPAGDSPYIGETACRKFSRQALQPHWN